MTVLSPHRTELLRHLEILLLHAPKALAQLRVATVQRLLF
jgi:hypothetical protein